MSNYRINFLYGGLFPELKLFPDHRQAQHALHIASRRVRLWAYGLSLPWCLFVVFAGKRMIGIFSNVNELLIMLPAGLLCGLGIGYAPFIVCSTQIRHSLREHLNAIGTRICVRCGYLLCGLSFPRCPECGTEFSDTDVNDEGSGETHAHRADDVRSGTIEL